MLKLGAGVGEAQRVLFGILGWKSMAGLALFGCGGVVYAFLPPQVPLNTVRRGGHRRQPGAGRAISPARWLGIACISLGIFVVGLTAHA